MEASLKPYLVNKGVFTVEARASKADFPVEPNYFEVWESPTGIGDPDSNPTGWSNASPENIVDDGGDYWYSDDDFADGAKFWITRIQVGVTLSLWSDAVLATA
jgi:hypothetical protein